MINIQPGCMALFYQAGLLVTGLVTGIDGILLKIISADDTSHTIHSGRICLCGTELYDLTQPHQSLSTFQLRISEHSDIVDAALNVLADGQTHDFDEIAAALGELSDPKRFALYINLNRRTQMISHKKGQYRLLSDAERLEAELSENQRLERQNFLDQVRAYIWDLGTNDLSSLPANEMRRQLCAELRLLQREQIPADLAALIRKAMPGREFEQVLLTLRQALGDISPDTDPALARSGLPVAIDDGITGFKEIGYPQSGATGPEVICVDDPDSRDYDDAFSVDKTASGYRLGVHISDVTASLDPDSDLFSEALERVSSLYLPAQTVNMLPERLAEELLSLRAGEYRAVLSLYCDINLDNSLRDWQFRREILRVGRNISYSELDAMLARGEYQSVKVLCDNLRSERGVANQQCGNDLLYNLKVSGHKIKFKRIDFASPARTMIEELMVLYNRLLAARASESDLTFLYRNINSFEDSVQNTEDFSAKQPATPGQTGTQAYISTRPMFHPGIGAKAYMHASSPIRRVVDLINQYQFTALLEGESCPFDQDWLNSIVPAIEKRLLLQREVVRQSERYWLLQYLKREWLHRPLDAFFIKASRRGSIFELLPWGKRIIVECDTHPPAGYDLKLLITAVDVEAQICQADVII